MAERFDTDVFVAGGGPAGLAAAIAASQAGLAVTLADVARPPIDKACGEGIMPEGIVALGRLGITPAPGQFFALAGMRFIDSNGAIDARFPRGAGCGVRRTVLHQWLVDRAAEAGVDDFMAEATPEDKLALPSIPTASKALCWMAVGSVADG